MKKLEKYYISDECHIYNFLKLDKDIFKYPNIKIETKLLKYLINKLSVSL